MSKNTIRATVIVGTTMALVIAGTAAVAAAGPRDRDDFRGFGDMQMGGMRGDFGMGGGLRGLGSDVERTERTVQTADGTVSARVEQGVVDTAGDASLSFTLGSGEAVTVVIDEDTQVAAFEEEEVLGRRGWSRTRLAATEIEPIDIEAGAEVIVWSDSEDDADFVASRVVVKPADMDEADAEDADADDTDAAAPEADTSEDAAAPDA
jgi:hypothetical protein